MTHKSVEHMFDSPRRKKNLPGFRHSLIQGFHGTTSPSCFLSSCIPTFMVLALSSDPTGLQNALGSYSAGKSERSLPRSPSEHSVLCIPSPCLDLPCSLGRLGDINHRQPGSYGPNPFLKMLNKGFSESVFHYFKGGGEIITFSYPVPPVSLKQSPTRTEQAARSHCVM